MRALCLAIAALIALPAAAGPLPLPDLPKDPVAIAEWQVPWEGRPRDPYAVSDEEVWFVGQKTSYLGRLNPKSGEFARVELDPGTGPHNLIVGRDGIVWYAGNRAAHIGRYDPTTGKIDKIAMPDPAARDPHTLVFDADQSHIFFTVQGGNFVGRMRIADRKVDLTAVPTPAARPYGIQAGPDGAVWVALFGTNKLAEVDPETLALTEHALPRDEARPRRLAVTDDGSVWYVDYAGGRLGRFDPETAAVIEWPMPSGADAKPYGMAADAEGRLWFVSTGPSPNRFIGFDPKRQVFFSITPIPSGGGTVRHMHYHAPTQTVWFGSDAGTIGRAAVGAAGGGGQ